MNKKTGNDLFIVDNSDDDWKVLSYLTEWSDISSRFDIATGYFEIGALLALDGKWQKLDQIRILMGDEVTKRTQRALVDGISRVKSLQKLLRPDDDFAALNDFDHSYEGEPTVLETMHLKNGYFRQVQAPVGVAPELLAWMELN